MTRQRKEPGRRIAPSRSGARGAVVWAAAFVAVCCFAAAAVGATSSTPKLGGTWSGKYSGAFSGTFTLTWTQTQSRLKGTIKLSKPAGTYGISGAVTSSGIRFGAVKVGATYKGKVTGLLSMSGTWASPQGGGSWSAHRLLTKPKSTVK
jgi:hypothetical protein